MEHRHEKITAFLVVGFLAAASITPASAQQKGPNDWQYNLTIYLWAPVSRAKPRWVGHCSGDPDWLEKSSAPVAWDLAYLHIHYASELESSQPEVASLLSKVKLDTDTVSQMTYALVVDKQDPLDFAKKWVADNGAMVEKWLR